MADKLVQVGSVNITTDNYTYLPKSVDVSAPSIVVSNVTNPEITSNVDYAAKINVVTTNIGEESIPNPSLFSRRQDYYNISDIISVTYKLQKLDLVYTTDSFSRVINYSRIFQESQTTNDSYTIFNLITERRDYVFTADVFSNAYSKYTTDSIQRFDESKLTVGKLLVDLNKLLDTATITSYKVSKDSVSTSDIYSRTVDYTRVFDDLVDATDDFYGLANLDDDQIAYFSKVLSSSLATTEIRSISLSGFKTDNLVTVDQASYDIDKVLVSTTNSIQDSAVISALKSVGSVGSIYESQKFLADKAVLDTGVAQDSDYSYYLDKILIDLSTSSDQLQKESYKVLVDSNLLSDVAATQWSAYRGYADTSITYSQQSFDISSVLTDGLLLQDLNSFIVAKTLVSTELSSTEVFIRKVDYVRQFSNFVNATDDFYGLANLDDDQVVYFGKNIVDEIDLLTTFSYTISKALISASSAEEQAAFNLSKSLSSELSGIADSSLVMYSSKIISDTTQTGEIFSKILNTQYANQISSNTVIENSISKLAESSIYFADTITAVVTGKGISESIAITDDVISFFKYGNRFFFETAAIGSSGVINNQNYFAGTYVEPGYVGTNTYIS